MTDVIGRMLAARAGRILRLELIFAIMSLAFMIIFLASSVYFEATYGTGSYSFALAGIGLVSSILFFFTLFTIFKNNLKYRAMSGRHGLSSRLMVLASSIYIALYSFAAYAVAFGLFGLNMPWHAPGMDYLYVSYFLLMESALFLGRGASIYYFLKKHMISSVDNIKR